jgi:hypothetical protein
MSGVTSHRDSDDLVDAHGGTCQRIRLSDNIIGTARKAAEGPTEKFLGHMTKVPYNLSDIGTNSTSAGHINSGIPPSRVGGRSL